MTVYQGVLEYVAGGSKVDGTVRTYDGDGNRVFTELDQTALGGQNVSRREFIRIGGQELRNVHLTNYQDELLQSCIGQSISISATKTGGGYIVKAIKLPDGRVEKTGDSESWGTLLVVTLWAAVPFLFFVALTWVGLTLRIQVLSILAGLGALFFAWIVLKTARAVLTGRSEL